MHDMHKAGCLAFTDDKHSIKRNEVLKIAMLYSKDCDALIMNYPNDKAIANARAFIDAGGKAEWQFIVFDHNKHQIDRLYKLIDCVSNSNTNLIKFQVFLPEERVSKDHFEFKLYSKLALNEENWIKASTYALKKRLVIFADVFGEKSLE